MTSVPKEIDISEIRESLGAIMASFVYIYEPYGLLKEIDITMSFETAMLDVLGRWTDLHWGKDGIWVNLPPRRTPNAFIMMDIPKLSPQELTDLRRRVRTYKELFDVFRLWWESAVESYNSQTGDWKSSIIICSNLRAHLMRIALKEQLVSLSSSMYTINLQKSETPLGDAFFADESEKGPSKGKSKKG